MSHDKLNHHSSIPTKSVPIKDALNSLLSSLLIFNGHFTRIAGSVGLMATSEDGLYFLFTIYNISDKSDNVWKACATPSGISKYAPFVDDNSQEKCFIKVGEFFLKSKATS